MQYLAVQEHEKSIFWWYTITNFSHFSETQKWPIMYAGQMVMLQIKFPTSAIYLCWTVCTVKKKKNPNTDIPLPDNQGGWTPYELTTRRQLQVPTLSWCMTLPLLILGPVPPPSWSILIFLFILPPTGSSNSIIAYAWSHVPECLDWLDRILHVK